MNCVNLLCVLAFGCFLISPTFSLPANGKSAKLENFEPEADSSSREIITEPVDDRANEINNSNADGDSEIIGNPGIDYEGNTDAGNPTNFEGHSTGMITRIGFDGDFVCRNFKCPEGTTTCIFTSTDHKDGKNADVLYTCKASNGTVLDKQTFVEPSEGLSTIDGGRFSQIWDDIHSRMQDMMKNVFSHPFFGGSADDIPDFVPK